MGGFPAYARRFPRGAPSKSIEGSVRAAPPRPEDVDGLLAEVDDVAPDAEPDAAPTRPRSRGTRGPAADPDDLPMIGPRRLRRDRIMFYVGTTMTSIGGLGLVLGSVLHDTLRVPWFGTAYGVFGPLNATFAIVGGIVLLTGVATLLISLRGGVMRADASTEG